MLSTELCEGQGLAEALEAEFFTSLMQSLTFDLDTGLMSPIPFTSPRRLSTGLMCGGRGREALRCCTRSQASVLDNHATTQRQNPDARKNAAV